ncbi:MAG: bifunctional glutamate N-acetyltransferase/amino-acid acetyltransferase ArgJ [Alphaproteobacteria bacterium]|nr:bifunctional glutamate N-acetyltransferase/amino-acid acetyltransferase ArgJ [Alphaproteobacteria bacterium]
MSRVKIPSPLAPSAFPALPPISGVRLAGGEAGIRHKGRADLMVALLEAGCQVAGCYTKSLTASADVEWCRLAQRQGQVRVIIVNSGNSNAFTGAGGVASVKRVVDKAATLFKCPPEQVLFASTGVIGEPLPDDKITAAMGNVAAQATPEGWLAAATAIMTTDTFAKGATAQCKIDGKIVTINGYAKGSGMIAPDMATMLGFVYTDAAIPANLLQAMLTASVDDSFNAITVDGDTSTSDSVILAATGKAGHAPITNISDRRANVFRRALDRVLIDLAQQIVKDGEGAEKFVTISVTGAASRRAARKIGLTIANSPLVKTAIAGEDANWGRIVMAVGKAGERADRDKLAIKIGGVQVAANGWRVPNYDETPVAAHMKTRDIHIEVDVGIGRGKATVWTCDLTHRYIDINGGYRS